MIQYDDHDKTNVGINSRCTANLTVNTREIICLKK